jgi:hypothetical protein
VLLSKLDEVMKKNKTKVTFIVLLSILKILHNMTRYDETDKRALLDESEACQLLSEIAETFSTRGNEFPITDEQKRKLQEQISQIALELRTMPNKLLCSSRKRTKLMNRHE